MTTHEIYLELDRRAKTIEEIVEEKYQPLLHAKDMEILSLKMDNEALRKEIDTLWKVSVANLAIEKNKVRDLEERWGKLSGKEE